MFPIKVTQPSYSRPVVTVLLIAVNIMVFLHEVWLDPYSYNHFLRLYSLRPAYFHAENLVTHMFLHAGWLHVLGNMLFLWCSATTWKISWAMASFWLLPAVRSDGGAGADTHRPVFARSHGGASGAIAGVMGAYLVKFPRSEVKILAWFLFIFTFDVPAWAMLVYCSAFSFSKVSAASAKHRRAGRRSSPTSAASSWHRPDSCNGNAPALLAPQGSLLVIKPWAW